VSEQDLFAVVRRQRAHRAFDPDRPVSDELVERLLDAGRFAPSSENTQPWVFVVVRDGERRAELTGLMERLWTSVADAGLADVSHSDVDAGFRGGFATAPVWIVVGGDEQRVGVGDLAASVLPAVQNLLLAATALGLGSAMTTIATYAPEDVRRLTGLPEHVRPLALVPVGWPGRPLGRPGRRPVSDIAHRERYGQTW
jgi:nitroreductase